MRTNGEHKEKVDQQQMPFSEDAEKGLLCSLALGGDEVAVELALPKEAFYIPAHQILWEVLNDLVAEKRPLEFVIVKNRLLTLRQWEEVGGREYLSEVYGFVPSFANYKHYAQIVMDNYRLRQAILGTRSMLSRLLDRGRASWEELRDEIQLEYAQLLDAGEADEMTTKELTLDWLEELATRAERLKREGIGFGITKLDDRLGMQQPGELVTIGAQTSTGKSMLAYQGVAYNIAIKKLPVGVMSLEMTARQTWDRLASHLKRISMDSFRKGEFNEEGSRGVNEFAMQMINEMPLYFCYRRMDIDRVKSWMRRSKARYGIRLGVVDYLQRVGVPRRLQKLSRQEQVAYVSNELKNLAMELGIVLWCPVQLNKGDEVRESAAIQFDADIAIRIQAEKEPDSGVIIFDKVRQAYRGAPLPVWIRGWRQTIEERDE